MYWINKKVQNQCLHIWHCADKKIPNIELHHESKILPFKLRCKSAICKFFFNKVRLSPEIMMEPVRKGNRSSFKQIIHLSMPKTNRFKNCLSYAGCQLGNDLPVSMRMSNNLISFRRILNEYMHDHVISSNKLRL